jgi:archaellum biogenesis protein FlaJ (TadC family)
MDNILSNEKVTNLIVIVGSITIPYVFIQYQIYQMRQEIEQLNKKLISTIQQVASIKIEESKIETLFSHLRQIASQMKSEKVLLQNITTTVRNQQRILNELINQLNTEGITNIVHRPVTIINEENTDESIVLDSEKKKKKEKKKSSLEDLGL